MTVRELVNLLATYNPAAIVEVVVDNYPKPFKIYFGSSGGCTKKNCDVVSLFTGGSQEAAAPPVAKN
jgi:hypothetical protein